MKTMKKISQLNAPICVAKINILIIGLRGLGIEIAKDMIVSGPNKVSIFDTNEVIIEYLGNNFYLSDNDIGKKRDEASLSKLQKLNKYVIVDYLKDISSIQKIDNLKNIIISNYKVIVISEIIPKKSILFLDEISRENKICLIYFVIFGLSSFIFTDFGPILLFTMKLAFKKGKK
jgi:ubiquitin-activating enzyme E1